MKSAPLIVLGSVWICIMFICIGMTLNFCLSCFVWEDVTVINDGDTILKLLMVEHPAARFLWSWLICKTRRLGMELLQWYVRRVDSMICHNCLFG